MIANKHLITREMEAKAQDLLRRTRANGGLAPVDTARFWHENDIACSDPFGKDIPHMALGLAMTGECVFAELGIPEEGTWRYEHDEPWALARNRRYNDIAERVVGRRFLNETPSDPALLYPATKQLHDVFESENVWQAESWWLKQSARSPDELSALLDRVEARNRDLRAFILPANWESEKKRLMRLGVKPPLYRHQRGPVTFATSVYGVENLLFLILDQPDLAARFRDAIIAVMLNLARLLDEEAGYAPAEAPRGFSFADDNCALLTPGMYEFFGYPVLQALFARYSPDPGDSRYQHSDSAMGHHLPVLGRLNLTAVNFGPTLTVAEIRRHCPRARIEGQLAPFTFSRNEEENIILETLRDFEQSREYRGVSFATAGSINNGSRLSGLRLIMAAIQEFCRY